MRYYLVRNRTGNTLSGTRRNGRPFVLAPNGTSGDTRWIDEDSLIDSIGLTAEGEIDTTNITIAASADFTAPITIENANIDVDSNEIADAMYYQFESDLETFTNLLTSIDSNLENISNATFGISGDMDRVRGIYHSERATGSSAVSMDINPGVEARLEQVAIHLSAAGGAGDFTITIDNGAGSAYDTVIFKQNMTSIADLIWTPTRPIYLKATDGLDIAWANSNSKTYGIEVIWSEA